MTAHCTIDLPGYNGVEDAVQMTVHCTHDLPGYAGVTDAVAMTVHCNVIFMAIPGFRR